MDTIAAQQPANPIVTGETRTSGLTPYLSRAAFVVLILAGLASMPIHALLTRYFWVNQDIFIVGLTLLLFALLARWPVKVRDAHSLKRWPRERVPAAYLALACVMLIAVCVAGHHVVMNGYQFSRDEQMVLFDAEVFSRGQIVARLPAEWAQLHTALNMIFMPSGFAGEGWISIYRPVNAALHALVGLVGDPMWTNPLLAAIGLIATWRVAASMLPDQPESQFVAVLLYATSTQVLALGMTSYAMTGHLALNMVWLALFLHDRWYAHIGALVVGLLAIGLHQIIYHPLFAGPFLFFGLVLQRRWGWSAVYAVVYAAGILWWSRYSLYPLRELAVHPAPSDGDRFLLSRMLWAVREISFEYLWIKGANLARFFAWQNLLLLPLLLVGTRIAVKSRDWRLWAMVAAIVVLIVFKLVLRPYQGHGWGYRYMHGIVGIACILAAVGWRELRSRNAIAQVHLRIATAATLLLAAPWLLWQAHQFSGVFAQADRAIALIDADVVVVEDGATDFAQDLVYNPPYLERRPIRLLAGKLTEADMARACAGRSVAFVDAEQLTPLAQEFERQVDPQRRRIASLEAAARTTGCEVRD